MKALYTSREAWRFGDVVAEDLRGLYEPLEPSNRGPHLSLGAGPHAYAACTSPSE